MTEEDRALFTWHCRPVHLLCYDEYRVAACKGGGFAGRCGEQEPAACIQGAGPGGAVQRAPAPGNAGNHRRPGRRVIWHVNERAKSVNSYAPSLGVVENRAGGGYLTERRDCESVNSVDRGLQRYKTCRSTGGGVGINVRGDKRPRVGQPGRSWVVVTLNQSINWGRLVVTEQHMISHIAG